MTIKFDQPVVGTVTLEEVVSRIPVENRLFDTPNQARYDEGAAYADQMDYVTLSYRNVWGGRASNGGCVTSYERIGYHGGSSSFALGLIAEGCPVYAACEDGDMLVWKRVVV